MAQIVLGLFLVIGNFAIEGSVVTDLDINIWKRVLIITVSSFF